VYIPQRGVFLAFRWEEREGVYEEDKRGFSQIKLSTGGEIQRPGGGGRRRIHLTLIMSGGPRE